MLLVAAFPAGLMYASPADAGGVQGAAYLGINHVGGIRDPSGNDTTMSSALLGASLSWRPLHYLLVGGSADLAAEPLGHDESFWAGHSGVSLGGEVIRATMVGEFGLHSYEEMGSGLFSSSDGRAVSLPFYGVRSTFDLRSPKTAGFFGWWLAVRRDIGRAQAADHSGGLGSPNDGPWQVGGTAVGFGVRIGFDLDSAAIEKIGARVATPNRSGSAAGERPVQLAPVPAVERKSGPTPQWR